MIMVLFFYNLSEFDVNVLVKKKKNMTASSFLSLTIPYHLTAHAPSSSALLTIILYQTITVSKFPFIPFNVHLQSIV